jgi:hypothetical protein
MKHKRSAVDKMDAFARPLPHFNIEGMEKVSSFVGLAFSLLMYLIILGYAASRIIILFGTGNPIISTYTVESEYELD